MEKLKKKEDKGKLNHIDYKWFGFGNEEELTNRLVDDYDWSDHCYFMVTQSGGIPILKKTFIKQCMNDDDMKQVLKDHQLQIFYGKWETKRANKGKNAKRGKTRRMTTSKAKTKATTKTETTTPKKQRPQRKAAQKAKNKNWDSVFLTDKENSVGADSNFSVSTTDNKAKIVKAIAPKEDAETTELVESFAQMVTIAIDREPYAPEFGFNYLKYGDSLTIKHRCLFTLFAYQTKGYLGGESNKTSPAPSDTQKMFEGYQTLSMIYTGETVQLFKDCENVDKLIQNLAQTDFVTQLLSDNNTYDFDSDNDHWLSEALSLVGRDGFEWIKDNVGVFQYSLKSSTRQQNADAFILHLSEQVGVKDSVRGMKCLQLLAQAALNKYNNKTNAKDAKYIALCMVEMIQISKKITIDELRQLLLPYRSSIATVLCQALPTMGKDFDEAIVTLANYTRNLEGAVNTLGVLGAFNWHYLRAQRDLVEMWNVWWILAMVSVVHSVEQIENQLGTIYMVFQALTTTSDVNNWLSACMCYF